MRKVDVSKVEAFPSQTIYASPRCGVSGSVRCRPASPPGASIWMLTAEVEPGSTWTWDARHGDEAIFVKSGELSVDGRRCGPGGVVVIEANALPSVVASEPTQILHMGPQDEAAPVEGLYGPAEPAGGSVHVVGPRGIFEAQEEAGRETRFFADATCPSCRLWLLYTSRDFAFESEIHSHSQDELIHVLHGEINLGSLRVGPGETLFIAAHQPYRFRAGERGFGFLNYRRDASQMTTQSSGNTIIEAGEAAGLVAVID